jgi:hypothetical protein
MVGDSEEVLSDIACLQNARVDDAAQVVWRAAVNGTRSAAVGEVVHWRFV